jgi:hypothetical protein
MLTVFAIRVEEHEQHQSILWQVCIGKNPMIHRGKMERREKEGDVETPPDNK